MLFYSTLYHSFASPRLVAKKGQPFRGSDGQTIAVADYDRYSPLPFWDTGRNQIVLLTLLEPELKPDILRSHLDMAQESGWMDTSFHGDHAVFMYLGDWERGLQFDCEAVYEFLRKNAMDPPGRAAIWPSICKRAGFMTSSWPIPARPTPTATPAWPRPWNTVGTITRSRLFAQKTGQGRRLQNVPRPRPQLHQRLRSPRLVSCAGATRTARGFRRSIRCEPYYNFMMKEATGWQTLWLVPHDVQGLINLLGGREKFCARSSTTSFTRRITQRASRAMSPA